MDDKVLDVPGTARLLYPDYESHRKSKENMVRRKCESGEIKHARKVNGTWRINITREWPELFGEEASRA